MVIGVQVVNLTKKDLFGKKVGHKAIYLPEIKLKNGTFSIKYFEPKEWWKIFTDFLLQNFLSLSDRAAVDKLV